MVFYDNDRVTFYPDFWFVKELGHYPTNEEIQKKYSDKEEYILSELSLY